MKFVIDLILTLKTFASDEWFIFTIIMHDLDQACQTGGPLSCLYDPFKFFNQ